MFALLPRRWLLPVCLLTLPPTLGAAQNLVVTALSPARNAQAAAPLSTVAVTFSQVPSAGSAAGVRVASTQAGGQKSGIFATGGNTITFQPTQPFRVGEIVSVSVPATVRTASGAAATPLVYQFTTAVGGPSSGTFAGAQQWAAGSRPSAVTAADLDGDGTLDLVVANYTSGTLSLGLNDGTGRFPSRIDVPVGAGPFNVVAADVDGDGDLDLLASSNALGTVSVCFNQGHGQFSRGADAAVGPEPEGLATGDVDGDGDVDLLTSSVRANTVSVRLNNGRGQFSGTHEVPVGNFPMGIAVADVDSDGDLDLLAANYSSGSLSVRLNTGAGTFGGGVDLALGFGVNSVAPVDTDGDGDLDLLVANHNTASVQVVRNDGAGQWTSTQTVPVGTYPFSVTAADVDGDGDPDLLTANFLSNSVSVRLNDGQGQYRGGTDVGVGAGPQGLALGDMDGDGTLDVLAANLDDNTVSAHFNQPLTPPVLAAFQPASGSAGTVVTVQGTGFTGARAVSFNGAAVAAGDFTVLSATSLRATVPPGARSGPLLVTTPHGVVTSSTAFLVNALAATASDLPAPLAVYPNPAGALLAVHWSGASTPAAGELTLLNACGQVVRRERLAAGGGAPVVLSVVGLARGMYLVRVAGPTGTAWQCRVALE